MDNTLFTAATEFDLNYPWDILYLDFLGVFPSLESDFPSENCLNRSPFLGDELRIEALGTPSSFSVLSPTRTKLCKNSDSLSVPKISLALFAIVL